MHVIRLHGPWEYQPIARTRLHGDGSTVVEAGELPPGGKMILPADWGASLGIDFRGRVRFTRRFGRPTSLDSISKINLVVGQVDAFGSVELNGAPLCRISAGQLATQVEVTGLLRPRNVLCVDVELPRTEDEGPALPRPGRDSGSGGGLLGEVSLQIFSSDEA